MPIFYSTEKPQNQGDVADIDDLQERVTTNIVSHVSSFAIFFSIATLFHVFKEVSRIIPVDNQF